MPPVLKSIFIFRTLTPIEGNFVQDIGQFLQKLVVVTLFDVTLLSPLCGLHKAKSKFVSAGLFYFKKSLTKNP